MSFLLSSKNVFEYLSGKNLCTQEEHTLGKIELKSAKNFNLLLSLPEGRSLLVKQEPYTRDGEASGEFLREWRIPEFLQRFPERSHLRYWLPEVLYFDADNSIIVCNYLTDHCDLAEFYSKENVFPEVIATSIGEMLAAIHRATLDHQDYRSFFSEHLEGEIMQTPNLSEGLERIGPEVFGQVPADGLKFFALYQRYDSLGKAIAELSSAFQPCCLTHNDLKLNNILLPLNWKQIVSTTAEQSSSSIVRLRLIDWERSSWGDPAFDLGAIITSYLTIWLGSLIVSKSIGIEEALRLAIVPLELIQPSIAALTRAYIEHFPEIFQRRPDFLQRVMQFSGLSLIHVIQSMLQYQKSFDNTGICMLQVAKTLLCRPEIAIPTVFGVKESELVRGAGIAPAINPA